jgi:LysR family transcriptional regulator for metE and metH
MIELKHLKTLQTLRDAGSLVAASTRLHLTQSALSHQINEIELRLGYKFFIRKSQPIRFSEQGNILLALADAILPQVTQALERCRYPSARRLTIAIECHSCIQWLMPALNTFRQAQPEISLELESGIVFDLHPVLQRGELDVLITSDRLVTPQLSYTPLFDFEVRLVLSPDHPLSLQRQITPADLAEYALLTYPVSKHRLDIWQHFLLPAGVAPRIKTVDNTALLIQMASAGMGITALPHWAVETFEKQGLVVTRPLGKGLWRRLYGATREGEQYQPVIEHFIKTLKQHGFQRLRLIRPPQ